MVYKARLHHDACRPQSDHAFVDTEGAYNVAVPEGATGIVMQRHADRDGIVNSQVYWDFHLDSEPMTAIDQGFSLPTGGALVQLWFDPATCRYLNFWLETNAELFYRFISAARPT